MSKEKAMQRLHMMGDWFQLQGFHSDNLMRDLEPFKDDWKPYNAKNPNNREGLSITSLDGGLSGVPDLDSLYEYNQEHGSDLKNHDIREFTPVYDRSVELQRIIRPYKPWLGRCHYLRINAGGYFPEHYDIEKTDYSYDEIRLAGFVWNCNINSFKFLYEDQVMNLKNGTLWYFNANKRHSVFSFKDNAIMIVMCLKFDEDLFRVLTEQGYLK